MIVFMKGKVVAIRKWKEDFIPLIEVKPNKEMLLGNEDSLKADLKVNDLIEGLLFCGNPSVFVVTNIVNYENVHGEGSSTLSLSEGDFEFESCRYDEFKDLELAELSPQEVKKIIKKKKVIVDSVEEVGVLRHKENDLLYNAYLIDDIIRLVKLPQTKNLEKVK